MSRMLFWAGLSFLITGVYSFSQELDASTDAGWFQKRDVVRLVDTGPIAGKMNIKVRRAKVPAFRFEAFKAGDKVTSLKLTLTNKYKNSPLIPHLVIEGPLNDYGDKVEPGRVEAWKRATAKEGGAVLEVTLPKPGLYRIITGTHRLLIEGKPVNADLRLEMKCTGVCSPPEMSAKDFFKLLKQSGKLEVLLAGLEKRLERTIESAELRKVLMDKVRTALASKDMEDLDRFPTFGPANKLQQIRPILAMLQQPAPRKASKEYRGEALEDLLKDCSGVTRLAPRPLSKDIPGLSYDHFPNGSLSPCQVKHSQLLSEIFTQLVVDKDAFVKYDGKEYREPKPLAEALIREGHTIEVRNERTYANFIALSYNGTNIRWPAWLDSGINLESGRFDSPMGHSQHAWRIYGPLVNARIMFYLGVSGIAFFPQLDRRPAWTGYAWTEKYRSDRKGQKDYVLKSLEVSSQLLTRVRKEVDDLKLATKTDGYLTTGICNDSNAVVEYGTKVALKQEPTVSVFPLVRDSKLDPEKEPASFFLADEKTLNLDKVFKRIVRDSNVATAKLNEDPYKKDALCRALSMTPFRLNSNRIFDSKLKTQLQEIQKLVDKKCYIFSKG